MNIREIEIFRVVMQESSISRAARHLRIAQPVVSKYIAQLERRLGHPLFLRVSNRIVATPEGKALFEQVERLFLGLGQIEQFMKDLSQLRRGHVTLACMPLLSLTVMPDIVAAFTRERREVSISLQTRSSSRIVEWVSARQVDFGVGIHTSRTVDVTVEPVVDLELFCALPPGHELEHRTELGPSDLTDRDIITLSNHDRTQIALDALLDQHKIAPRRRIEVFWTSVALELALRGAGIAFVDRMTAERVPDGLSRLRRFRPRLTLDLCLFWPLHWQSSALARLLADQIRAEIQRRAQQEV